MYIFKAVFGLAALAAAAPTIEDIVSSGQSTIHQVPLNRTRYQPAVISLARTMRKFGVEVPEHIRIAAEEAGAKQGTVTAANIGGDEAYVSPVQIGTPPQTVNLDIDTGSSDLWVLSAMSPAVDQKGHSIYRPGKSSTAKRLAGYRWAITYGDGTMARGVVYKDKVTVGGVTAGAQGVEAATQVSRSLVTEGGRAVDGIFGFAFMKLNEVKPKKQQTWIGNVGPSLNKNLFAAALKPGGPGKYNIGFIDSSAYTGSIAYTHVNKNSGFWLQTLEGYTVGSKRFNKGFAAISDTGTSLIFVPIQVARNYYAGVQGVKQDPSSGIIFFPCSSATPDFGIVVDGQKRTIPGSYIKYFRQGKYCEGGIQLTPRGNPNILGDVFLKGQYVVFDQGNSRIGYGQAS